MNLYRPKYKDRKTGKVKETPRWYLDFADHHGTRQRFRGDTERHATAELGRMLDDLVRCRKRRVLPKDRVWHWLMALPVDMQERLVKLDLAEREWFTQLCQSERLTDWVADFETWLTTSRTRSGYRRNDTHVACTMGRLRKIVVGCGFRTWADISKSAVEMYLGGLSVSPGTLNNYIVAFKHFCRWAVEDGRAEFSPVAYLKRVHAPDRETRRPLGADEVGQLLRATVNGPKRYNMTGFERAVLYRVAIETGFRVNELRHLARDCFDLDNARVRLSAEFCKDRRDAQQPITMPLASRLSGFLGSMGPTDLVFALGTNKTAVMLQRDAAAAGISITDADGRELVFHSLRHSLRTELVKARVNEAVIDKIMRHKPTGVGRRFYTHITDFELREAIERLPEYPWPADLQQQHAKKAVS